MGRIGKLRQRGRLQRRSTSSDPEGGILETWTTYATVWCNVVPTDGEEKLQEQKTTALVNHRVEMRYRKAVHPADRLVLRTDGVDRVLSISAVMNARERNERLMLSCTEILDQLPEEPA